MKYDYGEKQPLERILSRCEVLFIQQILSTYYVSRTVRSMKHMAEKMPCPHRPYILIVVKDRQGTINLIES